MSNWIDTPDELAVRQEDRAVESGDLGRIDWSFAPGHRLDAPYGGHLLGRDSDGIPLYNFEED